MEIQQKGIMAIQILEEDFREQKGMSDATLIDMLPSEPVDCFDVYEDDIEILNSLTNVMKKIQGEKKWTSVQLRKTIDSDPSITDPDKK